MVGSEGSSNYEVAYYENPGILMVVQTVEDNRGSSVPVLSLLMFIGNDRALKTRTLSCMIKTAPY